MFLYKYMINGHLGGNAQRFAGIVKKTGTSFGRKKPETLDLARPLPDLDKSFNLSCPLVSSLRL